MWRFHQIWKTIGAFEKFEGASNNSKKKAWTQNSSASENLTPNSQYSQENKVVREYDFTEYDSQENKIRKVNFQEI